MLRKCPRKNNRLRNGRTDHASGQKMGFWIVSIPQIRNGDENTTAKDAGQGADWNGPKRPADRRWDGRGFMRRSDGRFQTVRVPRLGVTALEQTRSGFSGTSKYSPSTAQDTRKRLERWNYGTDYGTD